MSAEDDDPTVLRAAADRMEQLAAGTTHGDWCTGGLLATRPEVIAHRSDGATEHVAEARAGSAAWITALSPAVAPPLVAWLRAASTTDPVEPSAVEFARVLLGRFA